MEFIPSYIEEELTKNEIYSHVFAAIRTAIVFIVLAIMFVAFVIGYSVAMFCVICVTVIRIVGELVRLIPNLFGGTYEVIEKCLQRK